MCGILGGTQTDWNYADALAAMHVRGPDSQRLSAGEGCTLGFVRLAVRDLTDRADQPMIDRDESVRIVFNGEIYGFEALKAELQQHGHRFRGSSDTEVVLHAYLQWGPTFVDRIDGMFAIAIHDLRTAELHLYRDRSGIKPLYLLQDGHQLAFASEPGVLTTLCPGIRFSVDTTALYDFFTLGYVPAPKSMYQQIRQLEPASRQTIHLPSGRTTFHDRYWTVPTDPLPRTAGNSVDAAAAKVRRLVQQSVLEQLQADVPVGCFLSGGIDSSIVVAEAAARRPDLPTFCLHFPDSPSSEAPHARTVADRFRTRHQQHNFVPLSNSDPTAELLRVYHDPFADTSAFPTGQISQAARKSVVVTLAGDGGDELFGGYKWYRRFRQLRRYGAGRGTDAAGPSLRRRIGHAAEQMQWNQPVGTMRRKLAGAITALCADPVELYAHLLGAPPFFERQRWRQQLNIPADYDDFWHLRKFWRHDLPLMTRLQYVDFHTYLPGDILTKVDRASMQHSLEVRVPFLKRELIEFAFRLPEHVRLPNSELKGLLKEAYRQILPADILRRPKKGFSVPRKHSGHGETGIRPNILRRLLDETDHANCLPFRFRDPVPKGEQHSGDADVRGVRRRRA